MKDISHKQAVKLIHLRMDGLLNQAQNLSLDAHLESCDSCRAYAAEMDVLTGHLQNEFQARWDQNEEPSQRVLEHVATRARRIPMTTRISSALRLMASISIVAVLLLGINFMISQMKVNSINTTGTQSVSDSALSNNRLIAFTSEKDGNFDIYTMRGDGTGLTNITNNPAIDINPFWSPDGKRIAFESGRDGSRGQIYLMNADGSNVVQLTHDQADHQFIRNYGSNSSPWSPDGERLIISQRLPGEEKWTLYTQDVNGENKTQLVSEPNIYNALSWSPDGRQVAFIADDPQTLGGDRIYVVNADGSNLREITKSLQQNEQLSRSDYLWSPDGESIFFISFAQKTNPIWTAYEARLADNSLIQQATTNSALYHWQNSISVVSELSIESPIKWSRSDKTNNTLYPYEHCQQKDGALYGSYIKRSPNGNWAINAYCPNGDFWFYYANSDGTVIKQLLNHPITDKNNELIDILWSPDDKFIAFNMASSDASDLYILDIPAALLDPSIQPVKITNSYGASWQPVLNDEVVEQEPTPEPTQISSADSLIAFTADNNNAANTNMDIYTIRLDGSNLTNLTHDPVKDFNANDYNPALSPDRKKIAFMSERGSTTTGNTNIFVMNQDGSGLSQLTYNPGYDAFLSWSPNGEQIVYYSSPMAESNTKGQLIVMNADGSDKTVLTPLGYYYFRSWSPDSQKIVYVQPRLDGKSYQEARIHVVDIDGKNRREWFADRINQIRWEDSEHFLGVDQTGEDTQATWSLYQFNTHGSQIELATHREPIVAIFEQSYVVEGQDGLTWFALQGTPISLSPWNVAEECETTGDSYVSTSLSIAPDQKRALVIIYCKAATWHYLVNEDGSEINQLGAPIDDSVAILPHWSPDEQYISLSVINYGDDLYLIDIPKMLKDPSATPRLLATNVLAGVVYGEPLIASNDNEEKQTPEPLDFSLNVYKAEKLAFFDVLEPSYLPAGYALEGVAYDPWTQQVAMKYDSQQGNGSLLIYQQRGDLLHDPVVSGYVTPVPVGDKEGEYIQGAWIYESPDTTIPDWDPRADSYSLTWQNGEFVFSIHFIGGETITPLPLDEFVAIAESLK